jgi:4-nitrophenyl phosphatase
MNFSWIRGCLLSRGMLCSHKAFIFDLDGCIYRGMEVVPKAPQVITLLRKMGKKILFLTNNATKTPEEYVMKLGGMGIQICAEEILSSGTAAAIYILKNFGSVRVFPVGGRALIRELRKMGHRIINARNIKDADFVLSCLDFGFNYTKLNLATQAIFSGARFIATNIDPTLPVKGGWMPGAGTIARAISVATGKKPLVIGKPSTHIVDIAADRLGIDPKDMVFIGDRLDTDIRVAKKMHSYAILVLSGSTTKEEAEQISDPGLKPDLILQDVGYMYELLRR